MRLFKRDRAPRLVLDPLLGDPTAKALDAAAGAGDWRTVAGVLSGVGDPDVRAFQVNVLADRDGPQPWIGEWVAAEPDSAVPYLVKGAHAIRWAWQARGNGAADTVSQQQFKVFLRRLRIAEDSLDEAVARDPDDPTAWSELIQTAIGRRLGLPEAQRRFGEVVARCRWHRAAHGRMLQQKCAKWGGSDELALEFARATVAQMPDGCALGSMIATAHFEAAVRSEEKARRYLARPEVLAEVHAAADRSVRHPAFRRIPGHQGTEGWFALVFHLGGDHAAAAQRFDVIGDLPTESPWYYFRDAAGTYARYRRETYAAVGR